MGLLCTAVRESDGGGVSITQASAAKAFRDYMRHVGIRPSQDEALCKMSYTKFLRALQAMGGENCTVARIDYVALCNVAPRL